MSVKNKITINFFGTGSELCFDHLDPDFLDSLSRAAESERQSLDCLFFDLEFFNNNNFFDVARSRNYRTWRHFDALGKYTGPNVLEFGQMEIWINRKKLKSIKFASFAESNTLFPLYQIEKKQIPTPASGNHLLVIGLQHKGMIARFEFETESFDIDKLKFQTIELISPTYRQLLLIQLTYDNIPLTIKKQDTLITGCIFHLSSG